MIHSHCEKSVLVTGAAGGIGSALVIALAEEGWMVIGTDHPSMHPSKKILDSCLAWIPADLVKLSKESNALVSFRMSICAAQANYPLAAIVHNAALQRLNDFEGLSSGDWNNTLAVNLMAPVLINRTFLPMLKSQSGCIVHIGSIHSQLTKPGFTAYATSKAALAGLTRAMAVELGGVVRVNALEPAAIATPMLEAGFTDAPELKPQLEAFHPTGCIGSPHDVARAVLFLLDPSNSFLNGCVLSLGGGIHSRLHDPA